MKCQRIQVYGKVQGVWFRASTKRKADELKLKGIVKNEKDGSVYIEAMGKEADLDHFIDWCKEGPELAQVREVVLEELEAKPYEDFSILR